MRPVTTSLFTARGIAACLALLLAAAGLDRARAADGFLSRMGEAQVLYRSTTVALRAGRADEAQASLKRLADLWTEAAARARSLPPAATPRLAMLPEMMEGGAARLRQAADAVVQGRGDAALETLAPLKREWITMRRAAGLYGLVECLDEASETLDYFHAMRRNPQDLTRPETRGDVIARAAVYRFALKRCDTFAARDLGADADYRRQTESIAAALDVVDSALRLRDAALLDRVLSDLKTFDTQLSQRYGG
jgi:hypothetical protein